MRVLVTIARRNLWRHKRRSLITAVAMAVGVALCMASVAFTDGMFRDIFEVLVEQQLGHVQVHHPDYPSRRVLHDTLPGGGALLARIDALPDTASAAPRLNGFALVGSEKKSAGAMLVGVDPARERGFSPLADRVVRGRFLADAPANEILLGHKLAEELGAALGDELVAVTQSADGSLGNALFTLVGVFKSGNVQMDRSGAYLHLAEVQELLVLPDQLHSVTVLADDADAIEAYATALGDAVGAPTIEVEPWWVASPQSAQMMAMRDVSVYMVVGIVFGAAAFGVLNTMLMSVFERTRELGVLKALGLRPGRMVVLILVESVFLAALASSLGLVLGGLLDAYLVIWGFDLSGTAEEGFSFSGVMLDPVIRGEVRPLAVVEIVGAVFAVSLLASLWPALRAARLEPVASIRSE